MNNNKQGQNIDRLLNSRFIDEPSTNLTDRIIHQASLNVPQSTPSRSYWERFQKLFIGNYPAFASASVVCLVIGLYFMDIFTSMPIESETNSSLEHLNDWLSFASLDDENFL